MIDSFRGQYRWLSNFWPCEVQLDGTTYPSVEHAYQAAKTADLQIREVFQSVGRQHITAGAAKKLGKEIKLRPDWEQIKIVVMKDLLTQKFSDHELSLLLIGTYPHMLVEGNNWGDKFWGQVDGQGQNHLGMLLMDIRASIAEKLNAKVVEAALNKDTPRLGG